MPKVFFERCTSIPALHAEFRRDFADFRDKRDRAGVRKCFTSADRAIIAQLDGLQAGARRFLACNGPAREQLVQHLLSAYRFQLREIDRADEYLHVTILSDEWATGDLRPRIDLPTIVAQSTALLSALGRDWRAAIEFQVFTNRYHPIGGNLLTPHVHAVVHGRQLFADACLLAQAQNLLLRASIEGAEAVRVQRVADTWLDLAHVLRYPFKAPNRCKTVYRHPETGRVNLHESEAGDRFIRYLRLFQLLSLVDQRHLMFAAGSDVALQEWALRQVAPRIAARAATAPFRLRRRDVRTFWSDFMPRMGWDRFRKPEIFIA